jgi:hypothetical protein
VEHRDGPHLSISGPPIRVPPAAEVGGIAHDVIDVIGSGTFSVVYEAFDRLLRRLVALKVLRPRAAGATLAHALREGRASARLTHPNIVPVHDLGTANGCVYLAMDLIDGETLAQYLERHKGKVPFRTSALILRQLAQALDYAHANGIVHRDVKPANVLIDERGVPRFIDFGLARTLEAGAEGMGQKEVTGSPAYMAPEQAAGRSGEADGRADVFSLGVVMYEMLTGRRPFAGRDLPELLRRIREESPLPPRRLVRDAPIDLELICLKALEKKPEDRFATAGAMETELGRWLNGDPPSLRRQTLWGRCAAGCDNRVRATAVAMLAAVLLVIGGAMVFRWLERQRDAIRQEEVRLRDKEQQDALRNATVLVTDARVRMRALMGDRVAAAQSTARSPPGDGRLPAGAAGEAGVGHPLAVRCQPRGCLTRSTLAGRIRATSRAPSLRPGRWPSTLRASGWPSARQAAGRRGADGLGAGQALAVAGGPPRGAGPRPETSAGPIRPTGVSWSSCPRPATCNCGTGWRNDASPCGGRRRNNPSSPWDSPRTAPGYGAATVPAASSRCRSPTSAKRCPGPSARRAS